MAGSQEACKEYLATPSPCAPAPPTRICGPPQDRAVEGPARSGRSEERRGGKEWRSRCDWSSDVCSSDLARNTLQLHHRALQHHRPAFAGHHRIEPLKAQRGLDAFLPKLHGQAPTDTPHIVDRCGCQQPLQFTLRQASQIADLSICRRIVPRVMFGCLGNMVGQLGKGFGSAQANAGWETNPLQDALSQLVASLHQVTADTRKIDKALVNRIDFLTMTQSCRQAHHAV